MDSLQTIAEELRRQKEVCIYYHEKPDGDAIGSAYALALALRQFGIKTACKSPSKVPAHYRRWTDAVQNDELTAPFLAAVDSGSQKRADHSEQLKFDLCIDHHDQDKKPFPARFRYVRKDSASCAQLIFQLIQALGAEITPQIADFLYIGILTDTNGFCASGTSAEVFAAAAELAKCGADTGHIGHLIYRKKAANVLEMENRVRAGCQVTEDGRILTCILRKKDYDEAGVSDNDLEGLNLIPLERIGPQIYVVIRETGGDSCRVSVRTEDLPAAAEICAEFQGGGHDNAAGCTVKGTPDEVREQLIACCRRYVK